MSLASKHKTEFSGDGIKTKFKLTNIAIRPLISVEVPATIS